jgi:hypothetical protein
MRRHRSFDLLLAAAAIVIASGVTASGCSEDETKGTTSTTNGPTTTSSSTTGGAGGIGGDTGGGGIGGTGGATGGGGTGGTGGATGGGGTGGTGGATGGGGTGGTGGGGTGGGGTGGMGGAGGGGMGGGGAPPILSEKVYFWGDVQTDAVHQAGSVEYPGPTTTLFALDALMTGNDIASVAVSPDGTQIAVAGRDMMGGTYAINLYAADGTGTAVNLVTGGGPSVDFDLLAFSPDGAWLGYRADASVNDGYELWVVPTAGGTAKRVSQQINAAAQDVTTFAWQPDVSGNMKYIAYQGDCVTDGIFGEFTVEITANLPAPVNVTPAATNAMAVGSGVPQFDATGRVYFRGDLDVDNLFRIYRANIDGTMMMQVPGTALMNGSGEASVGSLGMSPSRTRLAFGCDSPTSTNYQVHVLDLATNMAVPVSNVAMAITTNSNIGPDFATPIAWSPDETRLAARADWPLNGDSNNDDWSAYVFPSSGNPGGVRLFHVPQGTNQDVETLVFTRNSARLFVRGDLVVNNDNILVSTTDFTSADQDATMVTEVDPPTGGDVNGTVVAH